jgi:hypothetical protein
MINLPIMIQVLVIAKDIYSVALMIADGDRRQGVGPDDLLTCVSVAPTVAVTAHISTHHDSFHVHVSVHMNIAQ